MKLNALYESYDLDEDDKKEILKNDIIDWCKENLSSFNRIRDFEIDDETKELILFYRVVIILN